MWRFKTVSGNEDSDQSISDEDDGQDNAMAENVVSLAGTLNSDKESLGIASQLDLLKGANQDEGLSSDDEVEVPDFDNQRNLGCQSNVERDSISSKRDDSVCELDKWILGIKKGSSMRLRSSTSGGSPSEALNLCKREKENVSESCRLSGIDEEATRRGRCETGRSRTHHPFPSNDQYSSVGDEQKTKEITLSNMKPIKKDDLWSLLQIHKDSNSTSSDELPYETDANEQCPKDNSDHLGGYVNMAESRFASSKAGEMQFDRSRRSMADLLDHLQEKKSETYINSMKGPGRKECRRQTSGSIFSGYNILNDEEDEFMHSESSSDSEEAAQNPELPVVRSERKTMADKFQEAFGSAPLDIRSSFTVQKHSSSIGLFGRLQKSTQWQKDQDSEFLKQIQSEAWLKDEGSCFDVKILSRSFDAKLTVCHCSLLENEESSLQNPQQENFRKTWTIIFSPRVCGDVDLDVGRSIRIYPPWKEVQVQREGEVIILTAYFSQM